MVLCHTRRPPVGDFGGTLKTTPAFVRGGMVLRARPDTSGLAPHRVGGVVRGHAMSAGTGMNSARQAGLNPGGGRGSVPPPTRAI